ncbi:MAG TPA: tripartite tricarboxylate transporter substrate binding protein [Noviherbaspirillum sp.]|nr:tripartite tricarboxylate transporter substrate binding protein [Noviherbaspirillum sp.]
MKSVRTLGLGLIVGLASFSAVAQNAYPSKPIRVIVPFTAGSTTDLVARVVTEKLSTSMGQPVIVENRGGAGGTIGAAQVAQAAPDGYTVLIHSASHTVSPSTYSKLTYDAIGDFAGVTPLATLPNVLVVAPSKNMRSLKDLLDHAKANPGKMNFASAGQGSATHLNAEKFRTQAKIDAVHIPFKGSPEAVTEVMTGRVDYYFSPVAPVLPFLSDGRLVPLAVGSPNRAALLPNVPTTSEAGVPGSEFNFWIGMMVPAKTPRDIVSKLNAEVKKALASPDVQERLAKLGAEGWHLSPEQWDQYLKDDVRTNAQIVKAAGIEPQ